MTLKEADMIRRHATFAAELAMNTFLADWRLETGSSPYDEPMYCGFAWVTVHPEHKGNTRLGKAERSILKSLGFEKDWTGKAYELCNPTGYAGQSMDVKEVGARAYAEVLQEHGFKASWEAGPLDRKYERVLASAFYCQRQRAD